LSRNHADSLHQDKRRRGREIAATRRLRSSGHRDFQIGRQAHTTANPSPHRSRRHASALKGLGAFIRFVRGFRQTGRSSFAVESFHLGNEACVRTLVAIIDHHCHAAILAPRWPPIILIRDRVYKGPEKLISSSGTRSPDKRKPKERIRLDTHVQTGWGPPT